MLLRPCFCFFLIGGLLALLSLPMAGSAHPYEIVRGKQFQLCNDLVKNLNEFKSEPPMACERKFSPKYKDFRRPNWKLLPREQAVQAAMAIEQARWNPRSEAKKEPIIEHQAKEIREAAKAGKLKVWEANFDIVRNGERPRVVMSVRGMCEQWSDERVTGEPRIGVMLGDRFEVDPRYRNLSIVDADVFFYQGVPYLASWDAFPSGTGREPGPTKQHRAYVFVYDIFWLKWEKGEYERGVAGLKDNAPFCQIGYQRLK